MHGAEWVAQVLVEAIIVEMEVNNGQDLGLQWLFADDSGAFGSNINDADARARMAATSTASYCAVAAIASPR